MTPAKRAMRPIRATRVGWLLAAAILATVPTSGAHALTDVQWTWRLAGGSSIPVSPEWFDRVHSAGLNAQAGVGARISTRVSLVAAYEFSRMFVDETGVTEYIKAQDPSFDPGDPVDSSPTTVHSIIALAVIPLTASTVARPYLTGGVGWMWLRPGDITYTGDKLDRNNESAFSLALGGGLEAPVSPSLGVLLEAVWNVGFTEEETTQSVAIRIGVYR